MNTENEKNIIISTISSLIDFLKLADRKIDFDSNNFKLLGDLRIKIHNELLEKNEFIITYLKQVLISLEKDVKDLYQDESLPRYSNNEFIFQDFTEAQSDRVRKVIDRILTSGKRLDTLIEDFLDIKVKNTENDDIRNLNKTLKDENDSLKTHNAALENTVSNKKVADLYGGLETENGDNFRLYRNLFIGTIVITVFIAVAYNPLISVVANIYEIWQAIFYLDYKHAITDGNSLTLNLNTLKYFVFKLSIIVVGVTLSTYFLRLSSFYQSKYEQAKQTRLELEAFPDYASLLQKETVEDLRKELALKYFGKDIDKNMIEKNGDLVLEQTRVSTELVKASLDVVKASKTQ